MNSNKKIRVCYFGTYREQYSRNQIMIERLRRNGIEVIECHVKLWHGINDRVTITGGGWKNLSFWKRIIHTYWLLIQKYRRINDFDVLAVGYPGQFDIYLARILAWLRRKPLIWDMFMSIYLIALERGLESRSKFTVEILRKIEFGSVRLPDLLIIDTADHEKWLRETHNLSKNNVRLVPTGADDRIFQQNARGKSNNGMFRVIYYGSFIPNHKVEYIIQAANILKDYTDIQFELIGNGPSRCKAQKIAKDLALKNVFFEDWLEKTSLRDKILEAEICLGAFGQTALSLMTIQNKVFEALAMAKPVITGDSPAIRSNFVNLNHLYIVDRNDPKSLVDAIISLYTDPELRERLGRKGYIIYKEKYSIEKTGEYFSQLITNLCCK